MNAIKDFNFKKQLQEIQDWIQPRYDEIYKEHKSNVDRYRMAELSYTSSADDYEEVIMNANFRSVVGQTQIEDILFGEWMIKIGDFCVESISYIYSIIAKPGERTHGGLVKDFLFKYSDKSENAKDFIAFWVKLRNEWMHNHKFFDEIEFREKYFKETDKIDAKVICDYMQGIFEKVNYEFPPTHFSINLDKLPRI